MSKLYKTKHSSNCYNGSIFSKSREQSSDEEDGEDEERGPHGNEGFHGNPWLEEDPALRLSGRSEAVGSENFCPDFFFVNLRLVA